jgi:uncharacterized protein (TIGR02246 family)
MKLRLVPAIAGLAICVVLPAIAEEQNAVDPEVRQQIEAVLTKYEDAYNKNDAAAIAALYTADAAEVFDEYTAGGGSASGREAIQQTYAGQFASSPSKRSLKLVQMYTIGDDVCAVSEFSRQLHSGKSYNAKILVREPDGWKIRMAYSSF